MSNDKISCGVTGKSSRVETYLKKQGLLDVSFFSDESDAFLKKTKYLYRQWKRKPETLHRIEFQIKGKGNHLSQSEREQIRRVMLELFEHFDLRWVYYHE